MDCYDCDIFKKFSGVETSIKSLEKFHEKMTAPEGTIERIWAAIDKRASKGFLIAFSVAIIGLVGTLFGLVYHSNQAILMEFADIKTAVAVIAEKVK